MSKIQVNEIVNHFDTGAPDCPKGLTVTGFSTFTGSASFSGDVSIGGTLTYEDVTNIDSVGVVTARGGLDVGVGGTVITTTAGGSVGIGLTNPEKLLEVSGRSSPTIRINNSDSSISADQTIGAIEFKANDGSNDGSQVTGSIESISQAAFTGQGSPSHIIFKTNGASGANALTERLRITHDGKIGIGVTSPSQLLHLSSTGFPTIRVTDADNSTFFDVTNSDGDIILKGDEGNSFANSAIRFNIDGTEKARITSGGGLFLGGFPGTGPTLHEFKGTINNGETFKITFEGASNSHRGQHIFMISYCNHTNNSSNLFASTFILVIRDTATAGYNLELATMSSLFDNGPTITSIGNLTFTDNNDGSCVVGFPNKVGSGGNSGNTTVKATVQRLAGGFGASMYPVSSVVS